MQPAPTPLAALGWAAPPSPYGAPIDDRELIVLEELRSFTAPTPQHTLHELRAYDITIGPGDHFSELMLGSMCLRSNYSANFGVWKTFTGPVDRIYHLRAYSSLDDRDAVRRRLRVDAAWQAYGASISPMLRT